MELLLFFSLLLMVTGGSSMNILQPTGYDCAYAQGGLSQQAGILYDHNMPVEAGGLLLVAAEMDVDRLARMKFFLCPREIPQEVKKPWTFDCTDKIQLDVSRNYQSAMLDWKLQYYLNITFVQVHIPEKFHCNRCGLQIEAEFKRTPRAEPDEMEIRCSFIHVHRDNVQPRSSLGISNKKHSQGRSRKQNKRKGHKKAANGGKNGRGKNNRH